MTEVSDSFKALYDIIVKLRGLNGCQWDREQTPMTLRSALIEETYECIEAIDENDPPHVAEELGDLFLLVTMIGYMHEQEGKFSVNDVLLNVSEKLIRRHPHVFGDIKVKNSAEILKNWAKIKIEQEGRKPKESILDSVSSGQPPMDRSIKLQKKAAKVGFDWPDINSVIEKIREELKEVISAINAADINVKILDGFDETAASENDGQKNNMSRIEEETGDLLFSVINLCRFLKVEPSVALHRTNSKFIARFKYVEEKMKESGQEMKKENLEIMDKFWDEAKSKQF